MPAEAQSTPETPAATDLPPTEPTIATATDTPTETLPVITEAVTPDTTPEAAEIVVTNTPDSSETPLSPTEAVTAEATLSLTETAAPEATPTVEITEISPEPDAEPELGVLYSDNFDSGIPPHWETGAQWLLILADEDSALATQDDDAAALVSDPLYDVAVEARFRLERGEARLTLRHSAAAQYTAALAADGVVSLYRGEHLFAAVILDPLDANRWQTLRLSVIDDGLRVTVNGAEIIAIRDDAPLPPGNMHISGANLDGTTLLVDDVTVFVPLDELPPVTPTPEPAGSSFGVENAGLTDLWVVEIDAGANPDEAAAQLGFINLGQVGSLPNTYFFRLATGNLASMSSALRSAPRVRSARQQVANIRETRDPDDPLFDEQWHLRNTGQFGSTAGEDANVVPAWDAGYTGEGVTIAIVDDGLQYTHPDLAPNYRASSSYDWRSNDSEPLPGQFDTHGTAVSGVAAAADDGDTCGVGAAYKAGLSGQRLIGGFTTPGQEAAALTYKYQDNDIYSSSWGPSDSGTVLEYLPQEVEDAFIEAVTNGRGGLGNIYVWAGGNGHASNDYSNADGYASSRYVIGVSATTNTGEQAWYSEAGANLLVAAPSDGGTASIYTTDLLGSSGYNGLSNQSCTDGFGGTSAAAPLVAGVVALMLDANPNLGWRDVQTILVETAVQNDPTDADWIINGGGFPVNHKYGFGRVDAAAAVELAENWSGIGDEQSYSTGQIDVDQSIPDNNATGITRTVSIDTDALEYIEHVEVVFDANHPYRGDVNVVLTSPQGTSSVMMQTRPDSGDHYNDYLFTSARHWGEAPNGTWQITVSDRRSGSTGTFNSFEIRLYGPTPGSTPPRTPADLRLVSLSYTEANLAWQDRALNETEYRVERRPASGGSWTQIAILPANSGSYSDVTARCDNTYQYRVAAYNSGSSLLSAYSNVLQVIMPACPVAGRPSLQNPPDGSTLTDPQPVFDWTLTANSVNYEIEIADDSRFEGEPALTKIIPVNSVSPDSALPDGEYWWRVRGVNLIGVGGAWSSTRRFIIDTTPPQGMVTLDTPENQAQVTRQIVTLRWRSLRDATSYRLQIDETSTFDSPLIEVITSKTSYTSVVPLAQGGYFWRVLPIDRWGNQNAASHTPQFFVNIFTTPADGTATTDTTPQFRWQTERDHLYTLEVDEADGAFSSPVFTCVDITASSCTPASALPFGEYIWRVNVDGAVAPFSRLLIVTPPLPASPTLLAPINGEILNADDLVLDWSDTADAAHYELQIDDNSRFSSPEIHLSDVMNSDYLLDTALLNDARYYWRARAINVYNAPGSWSRTFNFTLDRIPPAPPLLRSPNDGSLTSDTTPGLTWYSIRDVERYVVEVAADAAFNQRLVNGTETRSTSYTIPRTTSLAAESWYHWRIYAIDRAGNISQPSETRTFLVSALREPAAGAAVTDTTPTFRWNAERNVSYTVQVIADGGDFDLPLFTCATIGGSSCTPPTPLAFGQYQWRLLRDGASLSTVNFIITPRLPNPPVLTAPTNGSAVTDSTLLLSWAASTSSDGAPFRYQVQIAAESRFTSLEWTSDLIAGVSYSLDLTGFAEGRHYWRVRTVNQYGVAGKWSRAWSFVSDTGVFASPALISPVNNIVTADRTPEMRWQSCDANLYQIEISTSATFDTLFYPPQTTTTTRYSLPNALALPDGVYFWRVRCVDDDGNPSPAGESRRVVIAAG